MRRKQAVFVDTAGWIALVHRRDDLHKEAVRVYRTLRRSRRVTTDAVLVETCNSFSKTLMRPLALALMEKIKRAEELRVLEVIHVDEELIEQGWELFRTRMDKEWSLTDCISFTVMKDRGISKAITSDHHFKQAGFEKLL
ncbi:MAG: type II toxin-antitoxin system VapC family toxin [Deltaproteobacteria bacterium]|nr:type II toxin-antitoxin system VapC family toxin [Deltaproteobacteria bacterium]MBW2331498.1 type II toxin-antitoxin system VapC family toxin [Deltaproteobacteria bacterium]